MDLERASQYQGVGTAAAKARKQLTLEDLAAIYQAEVAQVWTFLARLGARRAWLEDLTHDVFVVAIRRLAELDGSRPARPWLLGIAYRVLADFRRRAVHRVEVTGEAPAGAAEPEADARLRHRDANRLVQAALDQLEPDRRVVLAMHELHELSIPEIAEALAIPLGTAYSRLRLGRRDLERALRVIERGEVGS